MTNGLRQRLVGAVVLVCLALILWPVVFPDGSQQAVDRSTQIPPAPAFEKYVVAEPTRPADVEPVAAALAQPELVEGPDSADVAAAAPEIMEPEITEPEITEPEISEPEKTAPTAPVSPTQDSRGLPESWTLQVASLTSASKAAELKLALQQQGYKAYTHNSGAAIRVLVGPKFSKQELAQDKLAIDKAFGVRALVVSFEP